MTKSKFLNARAAIWLLLGAFALLACAYSVTVPLGEAPDEVSHFAYIQFLLARRGLPPAEGAVTGESHQPPLYYFIGALSTTWVPNDNWQVIANPDYVLNDPQTPNLLLHTRREAFPYQGTTLAWHLVRLLSVALGVITVWGTWRIALVLIGGDEWLAFGAAAFVALLPEFTFISGMVNNDNLIILLSTLSILQTLLMKDRLWSKRDSVVLGVGLGLAVLTKLSGFVLWPFAFSMFLYWAYRSRKWSAAAVNLCICFVTATLIATPLFAYDFINFGDPLGWSKVIAITSLRQTGLNLSDWLTISSGLFASFVGRFGGAVQLTLPDAFYWVFGFGIILSLIGWASYARDALAGRSRSQLLAILLVFALFWLFLLVSYIRWMITVIGTDQARQLFPGLPLLSIFLIAGISCLATRHTKGLMLALGAGGVALSLAVLVILVTLYSPPPVFAQVSRDPSHADFGRTIRVLDYRIDRTSVKPGESIGVQFDWQALKAPGEDYWLQLQLAGPDGVVANKDGVPSAGRRTTDWWSTGQVESSRHTFVVPSDVAPGSYMLLLGLHSFGGWDWLRVNGQDRLSLGQVVVGPAPGG